MYASKRTIGKQGLFHVPASKVEGRGKRFSNRPNKRGRKYFTQEVKDEHGYVKRVLMHVTSGDTFRIKRARKRLRKSMETQPG